MEQTYIKAASNLPESAEKDNAVQLVGFSIDNQLFGVDILIVQEIIRKAPITAVPNSLDFVEGVINLRGNIIPVIDLRKRLGLFDPINDAKRNQRILIVTISDRVTGFIVDSVSRVLKISSDTIKPPPDIVAAGLKSQYIQGVCKIDEKLLVLLDFNRILLVDEIKKLKNMDTI